MQGLVARFGPSVRAHIATDRAHTRLSHQARRCNVHAGFQNERPSRSGFPAGLVIARQIHGVVLAPLSSIRAAARFLQGGPELKPMSRVLCAVAIDEQSHRVLDHALALARRLDARLLILHAVSPVIAYSHGATERVDLLRRLRLRAEAAGVDVRVEVQQGPTDEIILLHARARNVDRIVIGGARSERRRGWSRWIAERVLRDAPCPTLIVPDTAVDPPPSQNPSCALWISRPPRRRWWRRHCVFRMMTGGASRCFTLRADVMMQPWTSCSP